MTKIVNWKEETALGKRLRDLPSYWLVQRYPAVLLLRRPFLKCLIQTAVLEADSGAGKRGYESFKAKRVNALETPVSFE